MYSLIYAIWEGSLCVYIYVCVYLLVPGEGARVVGFYLLCKMSLCVYLFCAIWVRSSFACVITYLYNVVREFVFVFVSVSVFDECFAVM